MRAANVVAIGAGLLVAVGAEAARCGDSATATPRPPELAVLDRLVGRWTVETTGKPAEATAKQARTIGVVTTNWVLGNHFVQEEGTDHRVLFAYDSQKLVYRLWYFNSDGNASEMAGRWDEGSQTLSAESDSANGISTSCTIRFLNNEAHEWEVRVKDKCDRLLSQSEGKCTRRKIRRLRPLTTQLEKQRRLKRLQSLPN